MFNDDKKIHSFLEGSEPFSDQYFEGRKKNYKYFSPDIKKELELGAKKLKGNKIPRHLISLENICYRHDAFIRREKERKGGTSGEYEGMNIGIEYKPKMVNISSSCSKEERSKGKGPLTEY